MSFLSVICCYTVDIANQNSENSFLPFSVHHKLTSSSLLKLYLFWKGCMGVLISVYFSRYWDGFKIQFVKQNRWTMILFSYANNHYTVYGLTLNLLFLPLS